MNCRWICLMVMTLAMVAISPALAQTTKEPKAKATSPTGAGQSPSAATGTQRPANDAKAVKEPRSPSEELPPPSTAAAKVEMPESPAVAASAEEKTAGGEQNYRRLLLVSGISIFVLSIFVGFEVISKVPATLHTPLMSGSNAISGITVVGAIIAAAAGWGFSSFLGFFAVILATINVVGGFLVTHRMLLMFKRK